VAVIAPVSTLTVNPCGSLSAGDVVAAPPLQKRETSKLLQLEDQSLPSVARKYSPALSMWYVPDSK